MEEEKDDISMICSRIGDGYNLPVTKGIEAVCVECQHPIWISDTTIKAIKEYNPTLDLEIKPPKALCLECGIISMQEENKKIMPTSQTQIDEIKKNI